MPDPSGYEPLPGSERQQLPGSTRVGLVGKSERVAVTLLLRVRPDAPPEPDFEHWQNTPPGQREFLSAEEYMQTYSSTDQDVRAVTEFLESRDLRVTEASAGRRRIVAEGDAAKINVAFAVRLNNYRAPRTRTGRLAPRPEGTPDLEHTDEDVFYRGFEGPVQLPSELIGVVETVIGLDNRQLGQPGGTGTGDPPGANYLSPVAVAQLYDFPNTGAAGQTIGIFEDAGAGAAYSHTDIADFISSLPAGYNSQPSLADIGLTVGATTYTNQTSLVTSSPSGAVGECTIDVSITAAVAQGANINVYFSDASEQGWEAFFDRAINPPAGDNPPSALTNSWFSIFGDDPGQIGVPSAPGSIAHWMHTKLRSAHTRGITVFMAIGDWGSADQIADGNCHVAYPHSDPAVTACGGTIVGNISPTGFEEFAWSAANTASQFQNFPYESTGGGVSDNPGFPVPRYQKAAGVLPVSKNDGNARRGVPDVAGMVAMDGFFFAGQGGPGQYGFFGTSLVAPLYAGLTAVINAFLGRGIGFLNPTLYRHGPVICHDVRFGNNDSGNVPDAPAVRRGSRLGCLHRLGQHRRIPAPGGAGPGADHRHRADWRRGFRPRLPELIRRPDPHHQQHRIQPPADIGHHVVVSGFRPAFGRLVSACDRARRSHRHRDPLPARRPGPERRHADHLQQRSARPAHRASIRRRARAPAGAGHGRQREHGRGLHRVVRRRAADLEQQRGLRAFGHRRHQLVRRVPGAAGHVLSAVNRAG